MSSSSFVFPSREGVFPLVEVMNSSLAQSPREGDIFEDKTTLDRAQNEEATVVERPVWQSFVLMLSLHYPEVGAKLTPALDIGREPISRITMDHETVDFLNRHVKSWYEGGVEILTIHTSQDPRDFGDTMSDVTYKVPYRPVTGLNVIVTPTIQRSWNSWEKVVLEEKSRMKYDKPMEAINRFWRVCVTENIIPERSTARRGRNASPFREKGQKSVTTKWVRKKSSSPSSRPPRKFGW